MKQGSLFNNQNTGMSQVIFERCSYENKTFPESTRNERLKTSGGWKRSFLSKTPFAVRLFWWMFSWCWKMIKPLKKWHIFSKDFHRLAPGSPSPLFIVWFTNHYSKYLFIIIQKEPTFFLMVACPLPGLLFFSSWRACKTHTHIPLAASDC